jgi:hypothetical protein
MEHRWGQRMAVDTPVRLTASPFAPGIGRLTNFSVSGGFIKAQFELPVLTRIQVAFQPVEPGEDEAPMIFAYVARMAQTGIGVEWCEAASPAICRLLQSAAPALPLAWGHSARSVYDLSLNFWH